MSNASGTRRAALVAVLALASSAAARADAPARTRVTIRGTGSNVMIEETQAPARRRFFAESSSPAGVMGEAIRLKTEGADDARVIAYLRAHEGQLPRVIEAEDVRRLRKAGAGKSVATYLASVAAVDIGETGEGHEALGAIAPPAPADLDVASYGAPYAYLLGGGYGVPYRSRFHHSARRLTFPRVSPMALLPGRPAFHRFLPSRATFSRLPLAP
jgi:hypothetical protein